MRQLVWGVLTSAILVTNAAPLCGTRYLTSKSACRCQATWLRAALGSSQCGQSPTADSEEGSTAGVGVER